MSLKLPTAEFVQSKLPEAVCFRREKSETWTVAESNEHNVGFASGTTAADAWRNAALTLGWVPPVEADDHATHVAAHADMVNEPPHYKAGGIETIDAIQAALTPEEFRGFCKGNSLKYAWRERHKGGDEDLKKAAWYLNRLTQ